MVSTLLVVACDHLSSSAIPRRLLAKIDQVLSLADTHNLPTRTPSQILNHLDLAYNYGRLVPHTPALDEYGTAYKSYLNSLMEGEEDRMREELKKCEQCSGTASCYNYPCAVCARVMRSCPSVGIYVCVCHQKNTLVYVSPLEILHENTLYSFFTEFIVL